MPVSDHRSVRVKGEEVQLPTSLRIAGVKSAFDIRSDEDAYTWDGESLIELPNIYSVRWVPEGAPLLFGPSDVDELALLMQHDDNPDPPDSYGVTMPEDHR